MPLRQRTAERRTGRGCPRSAPSPARGNRPPKRKHSPSSAGPRWQVTWLGKPASRSVAVQPGPVCPRPHALPRTQAAQFSPLLPGLLAPASGPGRCLRPHGTCSLTSFKSRLIVTSVVPSSLATPLKLSPRPTRPSASPALFLSVAHISFGRAWEHSGDWKSPPGTRVSARLLHYSDLRWSVSVCCMKE